jgi:hypothetical protein
LKMQKSLSRSMARIGSLPTRKDVESASDRQLSKR